MFTDFMLVRYTLQVSHSGYFELRKRFLTSALPVSGHVQPLGIPSEVV